MSEQYQLIDKDIEDGYVPEPTPRATNPLNKEDGFTHEEYIKLFKKHDFWGTRYPCPQTMAELGIIDDVQHLFEKCHLDNLLSYPYVAYEDETIQFPSTLQVELFQGMTEEELEGEGLEYLCLSINGKDYVLSIKRLEGLLGFPNGTGTKPKFSRNVLKELWLTIGSNSPLNSSRSKSNSIRSPVIRYFQRAVENVFYTM